ncbi:MAG: alpha/beta hydrolase [Rhodobacteraceae bacterium]|nr:alpha/beta hydrolase [Paracoccaceae bacterium]
MTDGPVWLDIAGIRLEGRCWGPPPGQVPTLVLLHEGLGSVSLWRDFPADLAALTGCGVFAYSRRGYGQSDPNHLPLPIDYMTREALDVLPNVLDAIALQCGILLGHSDGASIAAIHAGQLRDPRLAGLILMAPHFFTEPGGLASIAEAREAFANTDLKARMARHHKNPENAFLGWNGAWLDPEFEAWNIASVIPGIHVPVLAIQGLDDQYGTLAQLDALSGGLTTPLERLELADCRHAPHLEQPERTRTGIEAFVGNILRLQLRGDLAKPAGPSPNPGTAEP